MADIIFNGNGPQPLRCRVWNVQKEFTTTDSPPLPCQLHVMLEADLEGGVYGYQRLTLNPGKLSAWGVVPAPPEPGEPPVPTPFDALFNSTSEDAGELRENVEDFLNEHANVDELERMFV